MVNSDYLKNLNKAQIEAVTHLEGPLLIVAGAGSGKTKVLTSRIAHIISEKKAFPNQILAVTFTNKAAKEMQNRVSKILGAGGGGFLMLYVEPELRETVSKALEPLSSIRPMFATSGSEITYSESSNVD